MILDSRQFTYSYFANIAYEKPETLLDDASRPNIARGRLDVNAAV